VLLDARTPRTPASTSCQTPYNNIEHF
jgi:hypothetical protein